MNVTRDHSSCVFISDQPKSENIPEANAVNLSKAPIIHIPDEDPVIEDEVSCLEISICFNSIETHCLGNVLPLDPKCAI